MIAIVGGTASMYAAVTCSRYGTLLIEDCGTDKKLPKSKAKDHIAFLNLFGDLLCAAAYFFIGYISDHVKIWKLVTILNIVVIAFFCVLLYTLTPDVCNLNSMFDVGFIGIYGLWGLSYYTYNTLLQKIVNERTRASM